MDKIVVELYRRDNFVYGRILEMPEKLRKSGVVIKKEGYSLESIFMPEIGFHGEVLYLRGGQIEKDYTWFSYEYKTTREATEAKAMFEELIREWNEKDINILCKKEREYLSAVLKPFRNRDIRVTKEQRGDYEFINVCIKDKNSPIEEENIDFPFFKAGTMYTNMEADRGYDLDKLELILEEE